MKKIIYSAFISLFALAISACSEDRFDGANGDLPEASLYENCFKVTVDENNNAHFSFEPVAGVDMTGITPVWIVDGAYSSAFEFTKFYRKKGIYSVECKVKNRNGMSAGVVVKKFEVLKTRMNGFEGFDVDANAGLNMLQGATFDNFAYYYAPGWAEIPGGPTYSYNSSENSITIDYPTGTSERWQNQFSFSTGVALQDGVEYDVSMIVTSTQAIPSMKVKMNQNASGDPNILLDKDFSVPADEPIALYATKLLAGGVSDLKIIFDFGGNPDNTNVIIENICILPSDQNNVEAPAELNEAFDYNDPRNVFAAIDQAGVFEETCFWADNNWTEISHEIISTHDGNVHTVTIPGPVGANEWQAQYTWVNLPLAVNASDHYDCSIKVSASLNGEPVKFNGATVKLTDMNSDDNMLFNARHEIPVGGWVYRFEDVQMAQGDAASMKLVFDFGGAPEGAVITISDVTVIKK